MYNFEALTTLQTYIDYYHSPLGIAHTIFGVVMLVGASWMRNKLQTKHSTIN
jgi:hypothetical protein